MENLPTEIKCKIISYLSIYELRQKKVIYHIQVSEKINEIIKIYKLYKLFWKRFDGIFKSYHPSDILLEDIVLWLNDGKSTSNILNFKYIVYASRIFNIDTCQVNSVSKLLDFECKYNSLALCKLYLFELNSEDLDACILFLKSCILKFSTTKDY